jgi:hypothetical protein
MKVDLAHDESVLAKEMEAMESWDAIEREFLPNYRPPVPISERRRPVTPPSKRRGLGFNPWFPAAPRRRRVPHD